MVTQHSLITRPGVSTAFAAPWLGLVKEFISKLLVLETLAMSASSGPCLKGAGPSDAGPDGQPA